MVPATKRDMDELHLSLRDHIDQGFATLQSQYVEAPTNIPQGSSGVDAKFRANPQRRSVDKVQLHVSRVTKTAICGN